MMKKFILKKKLNMNVEIFNKINSTSTYAREAFNGSPLLVCASMQTEGRGRQGKSFYSPKKGLYFSLALPKEYNFTHLTALCGVSVCKAIEDLTDLKPEIKWVNDIYVNDKKVCGILVEATENGVIIGIGINLKTKKFPDEIAGLAGSLNKRVSKTRLISEIVNNILTMKDFKDYYKEHSYVLGKKIFFIENNEKYEAFAEDIDENFGLVVRTEDKLKTLSSGEISLKLI